MSEKLPCLHVRNPALSETADCELGGGLVQEHYLKQELYSLLAKDSAVFDFLQVGALDGIWYWNLEDPDDEWMSTRFWELLGYDPSEKRHLSSEWQNLIFPEDLALAVENFKKHCADPQHPYDQVVRYRHKDGSTVWVRCRGIAIRDETGKPVRMLGAHMDLTALKKTEAELQRANQELQNALAEIKTLRGILPICTSCKKIRNDKGFWERVEAYISHRTDAQFSHSICPDCMPHLYPEHQRGRAKQAPVN